MQIINKEITLTRFFESLHKATRAYLLLDFDGTLAPFHVDPNKVKPYPGVFERLEAISNSSVNHVAIISGRGIENLLQVMPSFSWSEIWGSHGAERLLRNKTYWKMALSSKQQQGLEKAKSLIEERYFEQKPLSIAFHLRRIGDEKQKQELFDKVVALWTPVAEQNQLALHFFDGGIELRPHTMSKKNAITKILSEKEQTMPIAYLGDDVTDEEAFIALGDAGLKVLVKHALQTNTKADIQLDPPDELLWFLDQWLQSTSHRSTSLRSSSDGTA